MKTFSISVLIVLAFTAPIRAQTATPSIPPDTLFPLGGLTAGATEGSATTGAMLPILGLNMLYNGELSSLHPGQGAIHDVGATSPSNDGANLDDFFIPGTDDIGITPYFAETDIDIVSNESGDAAWDLNNVWQVPSWKTGTTYRYQQLVTDVEQNEWVCIAPNTSNTSNKPQTGSSYWAELPGQWDGKAHSQGSYAWFNSQLWVCTVNESGAQTPGSGSDWCNPVWVDNSTHPSPPLTCYTSYDNYKPGDEAYFYEDNGDPPSYLNYVDNRANPAANGTSLNYFKNLPFPNTAWVATASQGNLGQPPNSSPTNRASQSWTQIVTNVGQPVTSTSSSQSIGEWNISSSSSGTTLLDYTFYANGPLTNGYGDFLGGGKTIYLDFISRLDNINNSKYPTTGSNAYHDADQVYELDATAHFIEQESTDGGKTWTDKADAYVNPVNGGPALITFGDYSTDPTDVNGYYDKTGTYAGAHKGNDCSTELPNILQFPSNSYPPFNQTPQKYSVYRLEFDLPQAGGPRPGATAWDSLASVTSGGITTLFRTTITSIHFALKCGARGNGLLVRGVRLRTAGADWLFRGKLDHPNPSVWGPQLVPLLTGNPPNWTVQNSSNCTWPGIDYNGTTDTVCIFQAIRNNILSTYGATAWNQYFLGTTCGNEPDWPEYRAYAYFNELFRAWTKEKVNGGIEKNIYQGYTKAGSGDITGHGNLSYYRSIYEDQSNGNPPPPFNSESISLGAPPRSDHDFTTYELLMPGDAIPAEVKNHLDGNGNPNFLEMGLAITGWNGEGNTPTYGKTSLSGGTQGTQNDSNDYQHYTERYQDAANGISSLNQTSAEDVYPQAQIMNAATVWTPFYAYPSTFATQLASGCSDIVNNSVLSSVSTIPFSTLQNGLKPLQTWNSSGPWHAASSEGGDWVTDGTNDYVCILDNPPSGTSLSNAQYWRQTFPSLEGYFEFQCHPPTPQEVREETWDGITWGAKGIIYNPIGDDGAINIGLCGSFWENTPNSGFTNLSGSSTLMPNGDQINGLDPTILPTWTSGVTYPCGTWVTDGGNEFVLTQSPDNSNDNTVGPLAPHETIWNSVPYPFSQVSLFGFPGASYQCTVTGVPTYYGMKDRSDGVRRSTADIAPIAWELTNLQWITSYDYADLATGSANIIWASGMNGSAKNLDGPHQTGDPEFPFSMVSNQVQPYSYNANQSLPFTESGTTDDGSINPLYYNIGVFHDPNDPDAFYTTIANRRTWPFIDSAGTILQKDNSTTTPYPYLGAIDARQLDISLKTISSFWSNMSWTSSANPNWNWDWPNVGWQWYTITNLRTGLDQTLQISATSPPTYSLDFDPGEGTLLRVAPATAVEVGRTNSMAYNNGHRVAVFSPTTIASPDQATVWEDNGSVMFRVICGTNSFGNTTGEYAQQTVYTSGITISGQNLPAHNPSIAAHPDNNTVGIVFSVDDFTYGGSGTGDRQVILMIGTFNGSSWSWSTPVIIANELPYSVPFVNDMSGQLVNGTYVNLLVPVITPAQDGYIVSYAQPSNVNAVQVPSSGPTQPLGGPSDIDPDHQTRMCSIASSNQQVVNEEPNPIFPNYPVGTSQQPCLYERFYFTWEKDCSNGNSDIVYDYADHQIGTLNYFWSPMRTTISTGCVNRHPMVSVGLNEGTSPFWCPAVTWEVPGAPTRTVDREMTDQNVWQPFLTSFLPFASDGKGAVNVPQPQLRWENGLCTGSNSVTEEIIYQDTFARELYISQNTASGWNGRTKLKSYAQQGSLSLAYNCDGEADPGYMTYRGIVSDESGDFSVNLNVTPLLPVPTPSTPSSSAADMPIPTMLIKQLSLQGDDEAECGPAIGVSGGEAMIVQTPQNPTTNTPTSTPVQWQYGGVGTVQEVPIDDSENILSEAYWPHTEDSIRTNNFPATTLDTLEMGRVLEVDTAQLPALLPDPTHYVSYKLVVKDSASRAVTQVLDSITIKGQGPMGSFSNYPGTNPSDTTANGMGYYIVAPIQPTPSGTAYITMIVTKDSATQAQLIQNQIYADTLLFPAPPDSSSDSSGGGGYKKLSPQSIQDTAQLTVTVHPNPTKGIVKICVEDIPGGVPTQVDVVDQLGHQVAMLFNATPDAESGLCLSLDCTTLPSGIYYADLQTMGMHQAVKFTVEH